MTNRSYRRPAEIFGPKIAPEAVRCFDLSYRLQKPRKHIGGGTQSISAYGPKQTWASAPHMSAFGDKADMTLCGNPLLRSLLGVSGHGLLQRKCPLMTQSGHETALDCAQNRAVRPRIGPWIVMSKL
jgi:hypothetical protein